MAPRKKRVPQLRHTDTRGIGWHVSDRDPVTGTPRKHRFRARSRAEAEPLYHAWVAQHLNADEDMLRPSLPRRSTVAPSREPTKPATVEAVPGSLLLIGSDLINLWEGQVRKSGEPRRKGTIHHRTYLTRKKHVNDFLAFLNARHGAGAVARMRLDSLDMEDVDAYRRCSSAGESTLPGSLLPARP